MTEVVKNGDQGEGDGPGQDVLRDKVIKQVEYYFGDINLMKDKFLKEKIQEDEGWVSLETMLKFNRLKALSDDATFICDSLRQSDTGLIEISDDNSKIRRHPEKPLPGDSKELRDEINTRSVYAKVFPQDSQLDALMSFFEGYGEVENIFMRRDFHKKTFKGSVFVTYKSKDDADKFVKEEGTKYNDAELIKKFKDDYYKEKFEEKKKKGGGKQEKKDEGEAKDEQEDEEEKVKQQMTKNSVLHLKGMDPNTTREEVKNFFEDISPVGWIDFNTGVTEGYLRLREPNSAEAALEKAKAAGDGKVVIKDTEVEVRVVQGDEELEYWKKMFRDISSKHKKKGGGGRGGRRGRGGPHGKRRSDRRNQEDNGPSAKVAKTDD